MSNSTGRPILYPYVVPRLSLADIAEARNHYSMYKRFHLSHKVVNFRTKTTKFQMCTSRNMRRFTCNKSRNRRRTVRKKIKFQVSLQLKKIGYTTK